MTRIRHYWQPSKSGKLIHSARDLDKQAEYSRQWRERLKDPTIDFDPFCRHHDPPLEPIPLFGTVQCATCKRPIPPDA